MSGWPIAETRTLIASLFGQEHLKLVKPSLDALALRQDYARFHYLEVGRFLDDFQNRHLSTKSLLVVIDDKDQAVRGEFELLMIQIGAHALACVMCIHALADLMAYATYHALGYSLQPSALRERDIKIGNVCQRLKETPEHNRISDLLVGLVADANFKHVAALANKSKHQALVKQLLNEDLTGTRKIRHEVRFSAFKYGNKSYPEVELSSLLEPAYNLTSRTVVEVGNEMSAVLKMKLKES